VTSPSQRPLPDNTQHSQETDIHALGGIRTRNPSKRGAADPRLRPRGHWDRRILLLSCIFKLIPVAAPSKAWICGRSLAGIAGSNPARGNGCVSCECCMLCRYRPLRRADHSSRGVLPSMFVSVSVIRCNSNPLHLRCVGRRGQTEK
jgi:hypothetical protein